MGEIKIDINSIYSAIDSLSSLKSAVSSILSSCNFDIPGDFEGAGLINSTVEQIQSLADSINSLVNAVIECAGKAAMLEEVQLDPNAVALSLTKIYDFSNMTTEEKTAAAYIFQSCDKNKMLDFIDGNIDNDDTNNKQVFDAYMTYFMNYDTETFYNYINKKEEDLQKKLENADKKDKIAIEEEIEKYQRFSKESYMYNEEFIEAVKKGEEEYKRILYENNAELSGNVDLAEHERSELNYVNNSLIGSVKMIEYDIEKGTLSDIDLKMFYATVASKSYSGGFDYYKELDKLSDYNYAKQKARSIAQETNPLKKLGAATMLSVESGTIGALQGLAQWGTDKAIEATTTQNALTYFNDYSSKAWNYYTGAVSSATVMVESTIVGNIITFGVGGPAASLASIGLMSLSSGGNTITQSLNQGYSIEEARKLGIVDTLVQATLEATVGGALGAGGKLLGKAGGWGLSKIGAKAITEKFGASAMSKLVLTGVKNELLDIIAEGNEEAVQTLLEPHIKNIVLGENNKGASFEEVRDAWVTGALSTALMHGTTKMPSTILNTAINASEAGSLANGINQMAANYEFQNTIEELQSKQLNPNLSIAESIEIQNKINNHVENYNNYIKNGDYTNAYQEINNINSIATNSEIYSSKNIKTVIGEKINDMTSKISNIKDNVSDVVSSLKTKTQQLNTRSYTSPTIDIFNSDTVVATDNSKIKNSYVSPSIEIDTFGDEIIETSDSNNYVQIGEDLIDEEIYSDYVNRYTLDQLKKNPVFTPMCNMLLSLVTDVDTKAIMEEILYKGKYKNYICDTDMMNKNNPNFEMARRLNTAYLIATNPNSFNTLVENNVNLFHGTRSDSLGEILDHGLLSYNEANKKGITPGNAETWSLGESGRDFVSFTDYLDIAIGYSSKGLNNEIFNVVLGTSVDEIRKVGTDIVESDVLEVGVDGTVPVESIKVIGVESKHVDTVKKMLEQRGLENKISVITIDKTNKEKFYYDINRKGFIEVDKGKYIELRNELLNNSQKENNLSQDTQLKNSYVNPTIKIDTFGDEIIEADDKQINTSNNKFSIKNIKNAIQNLVTKISNNPTIVNLATSPALPAILNNPVNGTAVTVVGSMLDLLKAKRATQKVITSPYMMNQINNNGIIHITTEAATDAIIKSQKVKASGGLKAIVNQGKKTFYFTGDTIDFNNAVSNINAQEKLVGIRIKPSVEQMSQLNYRYMDDNSIIVNGDFDLSNSNNVEKVYYGLKLNKETNKLYYEEITKSEYNNYKPDFNSIHLNLMKSKSGQAISTLLGQIQNSISNTNNQSQTNISSSNTTLNTELENYNKTIDTSKGVLDTLNSNDISNTSNTNDSFKLIDYYSNIDNDVLIDLFNLVDDYGYISKQTVEELQSLINSNKYKIGIHRTGISKAQDIIDSGGLTLTGHASSGVDSIIESIGDLEKNITFYDNNLMQIMNLVRGLKSAGRYKTTDGISDALIIAIPIDADINDIVYMKDGIATLKNEYVYGYVNSDNGTVSEIKRVNNNVNDTTNNNDIHESSNNLEKLTFSMDKKQGLKELTDYYGDAGYDIHNLLYTKTVEQILNELQGDEKNLFQEFLDNTIEGKYISSLSENELKSLTLYTGFCYDEINKMLRSGVISGTIEGYNAQDIIDYIDSGIKKYGGIERDTQLWRGCGISAFKNPKNSYSALFDNITNLSDLNIKYAALKAIEGETFSDTGYVSTSPGYGQSFASKPDYSIVLDIHAPKGTNAAYINQISKFYNHENEMLLARNTKFKILEVLPPQKIDGLDKVVVKCEIINNNIGSETIINDTALKTFDNVFSSLVDRFSSEEKAISQLNSYILSNGESDLLITRNNNARELIKELSIEDIKKFTQEKINNINNKLKNAYNSIISDNKRLSDKINNKYQEAFLEVLKSNEFEKAQKVLNQINNEIENDPINSMIKKANSINESKKFNKIQLDENYLSTLDDKTLTLLLNEINNIEIDIKNNYSNLQIDHDINKINQFEIYYNNLIKYNNMLNQLNENTELYKIFKDFLNDINEVFYNDSESWDYSINMEFSQTYNKIIDYIDSKAKNYYVNNLLSSKKLNPKIVETLNSIKDLEKTKYDDVVNKINSFDNNIKILNFLDSIDIKTLNKVVNIENMNVNGNLGINIDHYYELINNMYNSILNGENIDKYVTELNNFNNYINTEDAYAKLTGSIKRYYGNNPYMLGKLLSVRNDSELKEFINNNKLLNTSFLSYSSVLDLYNKVLSFSNNNNINDGMTNFLNYYDTIDNYNMKYLIDNGININDYRLAYITDDIPFEYFGFRQSAVMDNVAKAEAGSEFSNSNNRYINISPTNERYLELRSYLQTELFPGMSDEVADRFMVIVNEEGACSYAALLNMLYLGVKHGDLSNIFKSSLFKVDINTINVRLNDDYILLKLFSEFNYDPINNKGLVYKDENGNWKISDKVERKNNDGKIIMENDQFYFYKGDSNTAIAKFLYKYSENKYRCNERIISIIGNNDTQSSIKTKIIQSIENEKILTLKYIATPGEALDIFLENSGSIHKLSGNHSMTITGITNDGKLIVSTWGTRGYIDIDDILNSEYCIFESSIENLGLKQEVKQLFTNDSNKSSKEKLNEMINILQNNFGNISTDSTRDLLNIVDDVDPIILDMLFNDFENVVKNIDSIFNSNYISKKIQCISSIKENIDILKITSAKAKELNILNEYNIDNIIKEQEKLLYEDSSYWYSVDKVLSDYYELIDNKISIHDNRIKKYNDLLKIFENYNLNSSKYINKLLEYENKQYNNYEEILVDYSKIENIKSFMDIVDIDRLYNYIKFAQSNGLNITPHLNYIDEIFDRVNNGEDIYELSYEINNMFYSTLNYEPLNELSSLYSKTKNYNLRYFNNYLKYIMVNANQEILTGNKVELADQALSFTEYIYNIDINLINNAIELMYKNNIDVTGYLNDLENMYVSYFNDSKKSEYLLTKLNMYAQNIVKTYGNINLNESVNNSNQYFNSVHAGSNQSNITPNQNITLNQIKESSTDRYKNMSDLMDELPNGRKGANQSIIKALLQNNITDRIDTMSDIVKKHFNGIDDTEVLKYLKSLDSKQGICSYANAANIIFDMFKNNPEMFEEHFGYPMYRKLSSGATVLNDELLLVDLHAFTNKDSVIKLVDGKYTYCVAKDYTHKTQGSNAAENNDNLKMLEKFLETKGIDTKIKTEPIYCNYNVLPWQYASDMAESEIPKYITDSIKKAQQEGKNVSITINPIMSMSKNPITLTSESGQKLSYNAGGHVMFVKGVDNSGNILVDSWGFIYKLDPSEFSSSAVSVDIINVE